LHIDSYLFSLHDLLNSTVNIIEGGLVEYGHNMNQNKYSPKMLLAIEQN